jgi:hypothetical protein
MMMNLGLKNAKVCQYLFAILMSALKQMAAAATTVFSFE